MPSAPATIATIARAVAGDRGRARLDRRPRRSRRRRLHRISPRDRGRASPTRAGRIRTTRSSTPTDAWRRARSRSRRCRATSTPPSAGGALRRAAWPHAGCAPPQDRGRSRWPSDSRRRSGVRRLGTYALALDGTKQPCRVRTSNAGQVLFTGIARPNAALEVGDGPAAAAFLFRLGHPHRRQ